jgi:uncharacterized protein (TIGR02996 family)
MHDAPDDDTPRIAFADWLDEHGQYERAGWIRSGCEQARLSPHDPNYARIFIRRMECFERCRPSWWRHVTGVDKNDSRGLVQFEVRSKTAAIRLGKATWLQQAFDEAWLEFIKIGANDEVIEAVTAWKSPVREMPIFFTLAPQVSDAGLTAAFDAPWLWGLNLPSYALRNEAVTRLGLCDDLRELSLELNFAAPELVCLLMQQIAGMSLLRGLWITGRQQPDDTGIAQLANMTGLRILSLSNCLALTDAGLARLYGMVGLQRLKLSNCAAVTAAGIESLRHALPLLQIEYK